MSTEEPLPRIRLSEAISRRHILPFIRATNLEDISLYYLPVSGFPIPFRQRSWILEFLDLFTNNLKKQKQTIETFLQLKFARTGLNERFVNTMMEYRPMTGFLLTPNGGLPPELTAAEVKRLSENVKPDGTIDIDHLAPDYTAWFAGKQSIQQRQDFFGVGGMMLLWIDEGKEPAPPKIELPLVMRTHPAMKGVDFEAQLSRGFRLQHPFLARSREIFGAHLPDGPMKRHSLFILPLFSSSHLVNASPENRDTWFEIFSAYCIESPKDKGVLLAVRDPEFDDTMSELVEAVHEQVGEYPL